MRAKSGVYAHAGAVSLWPERLAADAGCGDAPNLPRLVEERGIEPHIPYSTNPR
jgi:hypothetical protein